MPVDNLIPAIDYPFLLQYFSACIAEYCGCPMKHQKLPTICAGKKLENIFYIKKYHNPKWIIL